MQADIMKAVVYEGEGRTSVTAREVPRISAPGDALLKIIAASVCGSDLGITAVPQRHFATPGVILGHECVAEVVELGGKSDEFQVGDRVVVNPMVPCGECAYCRLGQGNMCSTVGSVGEDRDGVFAQYYLTRCSQLIPISRDLAPDVAVFAEPLACALNGFKRLHFIPGQTVLIYGAGPLGLLYARLFLAAGASLVFISETIHRRLVFAQRHAAGARILDSASLDFDAVVAEATGGLGTDVVVDTTGRLPAEAVRHAAREGAVLLFGINDRASQTFRQYEITRKELRVIGSYATHQTLPHAVSLLAGGTLDVLPLLTHRITLEELPEGIEMLRRGEAMKVVAYPWK